MKQHRPFPTHTAAVVAVAWLIGTLAAPAASADPLEPIIQTVKRDREKACHDATGSYFNTFIYDNDLEAAAQEFARTEKTPRAPARFTGIRAFLGTGDPQAAAINSAYRRGAGQAIGNCGNKYFGVGFVRHEARSVDVVTIVFGALKPPPPEKVVRPPR